MPLRMLQLLTSLLAMADQYYLQILNLLKTQAILKYLAEHTILRLELQALTLLNDPVFFECAEVLGKQFIGKEPSSAIQEMFHRCVGRIASKQELHALTRAHRELASLNSRDAKSIHPMIGIARIIMNLDEFITRD